MSNLDKTVKLACKPKNAPPKAKVSASHTPKRLANTDFPCCLRSTVCRVGHLSPSTKRMLICSVLVAATFSDDGSLQDICRSLSLRMREPNAVVVFKALLVLHQMIRSGSTDTLLEFLGQGDALRLRNISGQNWDGVYPLIDNSILDLGPSPFVKSRCALHGTLEEGSDVQATTRRAVSATMLNTSTRE